MNKVEKMMITVCAVDGCPLLLEGLQSAFETTEDITLTNQASSGEELLAILQEGLPDILTLEISLGDRFGIDLIKDLQTMYPDLPILVLSVHPARYFGVRSLRAGAKGYLNKTNVSDEVVTAIRKIVTEGKRYIPPDVAEYLASAVCSTDADRMPHQRLSDREFEVFCLLAEGKTVNDIADLLSISPHTVHTYRGRIKEKMNISSDVAMTRYAFRHELLS